jgi:uncharacterized membrane protein YdjX (TVP38/TMEM64 family)
MKFLKHRNSIYIKLSALILAGAVYFFVSGVREFVDSSLVFLHQRDFNSLRNFILSYGIWAPLTSIAVMTLQSVVPLVPGLIITITNAWIFCWEYGAVYSSAGALSGAVLDFSLARWYGRPVVEKFTNSKYLAAIDIFFKQHGVLAVFITRLTPIIPFKVISYGSGLTSISVKKFAAATLLGQTPAIVLYSVAGQNLLHNIYAVLFITFFLTAIAGVVFYCRHEIEKYLK